VRLNPMGNRTSKPKTKWWQVAIIIPLVPLLILVLLLWVVFFLISNVLLHIAVWLWWCLRGRDILFVYSDSPIWHDYIEERILPHLGERAVVLNWSRRKQWGVSLGRWAFYHFGGGRPFHPSGVIFRPLRRTRTFRFLQPFRDFKHGHPEALHRMESEFFELIGVQRQDTSA
jgi:hypothetical protein